MEEFLKYWDEVLGYWIENGIVHPSEAYRDMQKIGLYPELMPEPYIGNPYNCSLLIMNYNPGELITILLQKKSRRNTGRIQCIIPDLMIPNACVTIMQHNTNIVKNICRELRRWDLCLQLHKYK